MTFNVIGLIIDTFLSTSCAKSLSPENILMLIFLLNFSDSVPIVSSASTPDIIIGGYPNKSNISYSFGICSANSSGIDDLLALY